MKNLNTNALENLKLDLENHVLIVTMNRPKAPDRSEQSEPWMSCRWYSIM